jgi:ribose transport system permease protein
MRERFPPIPFIKDSKLFKSTTFFIVAFIVLYGILLTIWSKNFLTAYNIGIILRQMSFVGIAALGQTLVLIIGGIDLSVGSTARLAGIIFAHLIVIEKIDPFAAMFIALALGAFIGFINGVIITKFRLTPFIVTLAVGEICYGMVLVITEGATISGLRGAILKIGQGMIGVVPVPITIFLAIALCFTYVLKSTPFGRELYAIGGNTSAARLVGINVSWKTNLVYILSSLLAAIGGVMIACRYNSGQPTIGGTWVMSSITAAVIGGASMTGGIGTMLGTVAGTLLMTVLSNSIVILNVSQYWEQVMIGSVVLFAVVVDAIRIWKKSSR